MKLSFCVAAVVCGLFAAAAAQANPGLTPGLWEHKTTMKTNDPQTQQAMAEAQKAMASLPPEQRRQMEQMLASQGIRMSPGAGGSGGISLQVCLTTEQAARQEVPPMDDKCTQRITGRTPKSMTFSIECPAERTRGEGEVTFTSPKAFDGRFKMQQLQDGKPVQMESTLTARWLAADCGKVRPAAAPR
jgi:hypothetical protein